MIRSMKGVSVVVAAGFAALVLAPGMSNAADQTIVGKKLLIINKSDASKAKIVVLSKDGAISKAASASSGDPTANDGSVRIITSTSDVTLPMPGPNATDGVWFENGAGNLFKYKKGDGIPGDACKVALLKDTKLAKAVCKADDVDAVNVTDGEPVEVQITTGDERYCMEFSAAAGCTVKKDGSANPAGVEKFLAVNCTTAPTACSSPSGAFLEIASVF